jgi:hypothetical protein
MSDAEWQAWQASWQGATGPLPDIHARTRTRQRWHRVANLAFFAMMAAGLAGFGRLILLGPGLEDRVAGWVAVVFCVTLSIGFVWVQRGLDLRRTGNPRDAVAFLERRVRAEKRGAQLGRVCYVALAFAMGIQVQWMLAEAPWAARAFALACCATVLAFALAMPWWVRRRVARQEEEIVRWRKWMDEQQL